MISIIKYLNESNFGEHVLNFLTPAAKAATNNDATAGTIKKVATTVADPSNNAVLNAGRKTVGGAMFGNRVPKGI